MHLLAQQFLGLAHAEFERLVSEALDEMAGDGILVLDSRVALAAGSLAELIRILDLREDIAAVVSTWTGIPVSSMMETEAQKLVNMEERLQGVSGDGESEEDPYDIY